jgi:putative nucleotidyltransferase with HDIG domain
MILNREEAQQLFDRHVETDNLRKHCLASEAIMKALAERLQQDVELWGIVGLLHDLDFELTRDMPHEHGLKSAEFLEPYGLSKEAVDAIVRHNAEALDLERQTIIDYALTCAESVTGLIVAAALVHPDRRIRSVKASSVKKRMKSKDFARNVNREHIALCERLDMSLEDFIELSLRAMGSIDTELGL